MYWIHQSTIHDNNHTYNSTHTHTHNGQQTSSHHSFSCKWLYVYIYIYIYMCVRVCVCVNVCTSWRPNIVALILKQFVTRINTSYLLNYLSCGVCLHICISGLLTRLTLSSRCHFTVVIHLHLIHLCNCIWISLLQSYTCRHSKSPHSSHLLKTMFAGQLKLKLLLVYRNRRPLGAMFLKYMQRFRAEQRSTGADAGTL